MACHFMDIYRGKKHDKKHDKKLPIMFNLHGGGFLLGEKRGKSSVLCRNEPEGISCIFSGISSGTGVFVSTDSSRSDERN